MKFRLIVNPDVHNRTKELLDIEVQKTIDRMGKGVDIKNPLLDKAFQRAVTKMFGTMPSFAFRYTEQGIGNFDIEFDSAIDKIGFIKGGIAPVMAQTIAKQFKKELGKDFISVKKI